MIYPNNKLFEQLANIEHQRWADWQKYMHSLCEKKEDGSLIISASNVKHWTRQINTDYKDLTNKEKDSDRGQVVRYWDLINKEIGT